MTEILAILLEYPDLYKPSILAICTFENNYYSWLAYVCEIREARNTLRDIMKPACHFKITERLPKYFDFKPLHS